MGSRQETLDYVVDQLANLGAAVSAKKMFGEYAIYHNDSDELPIPKAKKRKK